MIALAAVDLTTAVTSIQQEDHDPENKPAWYSLLCPKPQLFVSSMLKIWLLFLRMLQLQLLLSFLIIWDRCFRAFYFSLQRLSNSYSLSSSKATTPVLFLLFALTSQVHLLLSEPAKTYMVKTKNQGETKETTTLIVRVINW